MLELLITVCVFMSSVRRCGLDLLLAANVCPMCLSLKSWDFRNAGDFLGTLMPHVRGTRSCAAFP